VVTAAGTGSAWRGAAFMGLFWMGTVPALLALAIGMRRATGVLRERLPVISALLVIGFGVAALAGRWQAAGGNDGAHMHAPASGQVSSAGLAHAH
jgi:sulfite exporter TauE/SafE